MDKQMRSDTYTMRRGMRIGILTFLLGSTLFFAVHAEPLSVKAVADRPSLIFSEDETVKINVRVEGGSGTVNLDYNVSETCGDWMHRGNIAIQRSGAETAETSLPLSFPGRGHFKIDLRAKNAAMEARGGTSVAIVYKPLPADHNSPWGLMYGVSYGPYHVSAGVEKNPEAAIAENMRIMGASWVRLNLWLHMYSVKVEGSNVVLDLSKLKRLVSEFKNNGIHIMGEFVMTPKVLSSKPDAAASRNDNGPLFSRVKPAEYALWEQMVEKITGEFKDEIELWEIWNEVNIEGAYWAGTVDEFLELVGHTVSAIRRGNPNAKIASPGFSTFDKRVPLFFAAGFGKNIDILSVHYTDRDSDGTGRDNLKEFTTILDKHGLKLPIVNSEERSIIPLHNLSCGVRSFKFIHLTDKYPSYVPLLRENWEVTPAAVSYSAASRLIGSKKFKRSKDFPGFRAYFFGDDGEIAAIEEYGTNRAGKTPRLLDYIQSITVQCAPRNGKTVAVVDTLGRERMLPGGTAEIPFSVSPEKSLIGERFASPCVFLKDCTDIVSIDGKTAGCNDAIIVEAEDGMFDRKSIGITTKPYFSGGKYLNIYCTNTPGAEGYGSEMEFTVAREADYKLYFSGNRLDRLPESISPFDWWFDNNTVAHADKKIESIVFGMTGAPEGLSELGTVHLTPGKHIFRLRLTAPRKMYDSNWALWFDAIALVPMNKSNTRSPGTEENIGKITLQQFGFEKPERWKEFSSGSMSITFDAQEHALKFDARFNLEKPDWWAYPQYDFAPDENLKNIKAISFEIKAVQQNDEKKYKYTLCQFPLKEKMAVGAKETGNINVPYQLAGGWQKVTIDFKTAFPASFTSQNLKAFRIGMNPLKPQVTYWVKNIVVYYNN